MRRMAPSPLQLLALLVPIIVIAINVLLAVWVSRDARGRDVSSIAVWIAAMLLCGLPGLLVYVLSRPPKN